jgi:hypothetical protein
MSSAAEAHFRVQAPNSSPRATAVIALDPGGEAMVRLLAEGGWNHTTFLTVDVAGTEDVDAPADGWLIDLAARRTRVSAAVAAADQVIMVAGAGGHAGAASTIGRVCSLKRVTTTALVVGAGSATEDELAKTLAQLRPWSLMTVIANNDEYIADMMVALRA